jgi:MFS family permease
MTETPDPTASAAQRQERDAQPIGVTRRPGHSALLLVILCSVQFIDAVDIAMMGPAIPKIQQDLGMSPTALQWVVSAYVLGYGGFLLLGGRLADLFDRKRLLIGSMLVFVVASVVGGLTDAGGVLIAARLAKGIAAAFSAPTALAILLDTYQEEKERHRALGAYLSIAAVGFTAGLVFGGLLAEVSWRLTMFLPAALGLAVAVAAVAVVPGSDPSQTRQRRPVDLAGAVTVTGGALALVFGVSRASTAGWTDPVTISSLAAALGLILLFVQIERVRQEPLVPLEIFTRPQLSHANIVIFLLQGGYVAWQFVVTLYLQNVLDWSALQVGIAFAPGGVIVAVTAQRWAGLVGRVGAWPIATVGTALLAAGLAWTTQLDRLNGVVLVVVAQALIGTGYAMAYPAMNITAVAGAHDDEQGLASGIFIAAFQIGSGVVLGITASVFAANVDAGLDAYRAGIVTAIGAAALAVLLSVAGVIRYRRRGDRQRVTAPEPEVEPPPDRQLPVRPADPPAGTP